MVGKKNQRVLCTVIFDSHCPMIVDLGNCQIPRRRNQVGDLEQSDQTLCFILHYLYFFFIVFSVFTINCIHNVLDMCSCKNLFSASAWNWSFLSLNS